MYVGTSIPIFWKYSYDGNADRSLAVARATMQGKNKLSKNGFLWLIVQGQYIL